MCECGRLDVKIDISELFLEMIRGGSVFSLNKMGILRVNFGSGIEMSVANNTQRAHNCFR